MATSGTEWCPPSAPLKSSKSSACEAVPLIKVASSALVRCAVPKISDDPGEVATPILDRRPVPVGQEDRARMLQSEDVADLIRYVATLPKHVCINEVLVTPTWNRSYVKALKSGTT